LGKIIPFTWISQWIWILQSSRKHAIHPVPMLCTPVYASLSAGPLTVSHS